MVRRRALLATLIAVATTGCTGNDAGNLRVSGLADGDRVVVAGSGPAPLITVSSARGIGAATLSAAGGNWPEQVTVMLHLDGLEGFEAEAAGRVGRVEFSSSDEHVLASPTVSLVSQPVRHADGFSLLLNTQALATNDTVTLRWVDFYR